MCTIESSKTMAMVGSILLIVGGIPFAPYVGILSLVGVILLLGNQRLLAILPRPSNV